MGKITFITGGARSGKSSRALELAKERSLCGRVAFIATCEGLDAEMRRRISRHKKERPGHWRTYEEPRKVARLIKRIGEDLDVVVVDCLTLLVSNLMLSGMSPAAVEKDVRGLMDALKRSGAECVIVSNEVGLGIVPENRLGRDFRDVAGRANQIAARAADSVIFMISGIQWRIK